MTGQTKLIYGILTFLLTVLAVETCSSLLLSLAAGGWMTPGRVQAVRQEVTAAAGAAATIEGAAAAARGKASQPPRQIGSEVIHPYLGYVLDAEFHRGSRLRAGGSEALDFGYVLGEQGLFHEPSADRPVIAVTGGSVAFNFASAVTGELRQELLARLPGFERAVIVNLALPGYKQPQQLMTLSYFLALGAHFDLVINLDGFNEVALPLAENLTRGVYPFYPRNWFFRVQDFDPSTRLAVGELAYLIDLRRRRAELFSCVPWRHSPTAGLLWTVLDRRAQRAINHLELEIHDSSQQVAAGYTVTGPPWSARDVDASYRELVLLWQRTSEQMHQLAVARGIRYYHFLQPNQYLAGSKPMTAEERRVAIQTEGYPRGVHAGNAYPLLIEHGRQLAERGVAFHDLTMLFATVEEPLYVDRCCHLNAQGKKLLARAIAAAIQE